MKSTTHFISCLIIASASVSLTGCGILIGNTRPVVEKSENYLVDDLTAKNPKWVKLDQTPKGKSSDDELTETSDIAYKSTETESVIALNSACRPSFATKPKDLKVFTQQLLMGMSGVTEKLQQQVDIAETHGLETTIHGLLNGGNVKMKVIVLQKGTCLYDLMYLSQPDKFQLHEKEFSHFVSSLRLK